MLARVTPYLALVPPPTSRRPEHRDDDETWVERRSREYGDSGVMAHAKCITSTSDVRKLNARHRRGNFWPGRPELRSSNIVMMIIIIRVDSKLRLP